MELDNETFQIVTLALLGVTLLVLLVVLLSLSRLGRRIREGAAAPETEGHIPSSAVAYDHYHGAEPAEVARPEEEPVARAASPPQEEEPQEQPFERDGRWWFRRGDELLVYDEVSGQWEPAPEGDTARPEPSEPAAAAPAVTETTPEATHETAQTETTGWSEPQDRAQTSSAGSFWKCPSCGAINGSTATSCRMCFTPRAQV